MTLDAPMQVADQHHRAGRRDEAEKICHQVLAEQPDHPDALHLLGILTAQGGRLDAAVDLMERVVRIRPEFAEAWSNLARVLVHRGKLNEALEAYQRVARFRPTDAVPHYAMGIILKDLGRVDDAIAEFSVATRLKPDYAEAHFKLGRMLRSKGRFDEAITAYNKAIALKPGFADAHNNLANALRDKRQFAEAIAAYTEAIRLKPDDVIAHLNLGNALSHAERFADAVVEYERAIQLNPECFEAHNQLGLALANLQRFDQAMLSHHRALEVRPDDPLGHETLGSTLLLKHDIAAAVVSFRRALTLGSGTATTWNGLGMALQALGEFNESSDCFRRALAISPEKPIFQKNLITAKREEADPAQVGQLTRLLNQADLPVHDRVDAGFALGKLLDDSDRFDEAFASYAKANALVKEARAAQGWRYDPAELRRIVSRMIEAFTPSFFAKRRDWGDASELPVFIVGMPRSGTTLVEQIAASHPAVFGAGELPDVERLYAMLPATQDRNTGEGWDADSIAKAATAYLNHLRSLRPDASRVSDKMPANLFHLGLIAVLFPNARIIFCQRDGRDNCLSCFFQQFGRKDYHLYKYDLADCGAQYLLARRLSKHWLNTLPLRMLEMHYEEMVADQEGQSRRLIEFLGLPWDPACLEYHKTERPVVTASVWQVRQPIYTRSVGRWRHYERQLAPLLEVLAEKNVPDSNA